MILDASGRKLVRKIGYFNSLTPERTAPPGRDSLVDLIGCYEIWPEQFREEPDDERTEASECPDTEK